MFRCNLPSALLAEWSGYFTCHCGNTGVERTPNKSQHTKLTLKKKTLPPLLPGFELVTFRSRVRRSNQQAILASHVRLYPNHIYKLSPNTNTIWEILPQARQVTLPIQAIGKQIPAEPEPTDLSATISWPVLGEKVNSSPKICTKRVISGTFNHLSDS